MNPPRYQSETMSAQNIYYAIPRIAGVSLFAPINIVQGIYAKHYGLALTTIALVILIVRLFDAFTDPLIGYLSDRYYLKTGTRKPFMAVGALIMTSSGYLLYSPPNDVGAHYFTLWFMAFYLGFTLFEIPHLAWGGEISTDAYAKTQTYNLRTAAGFTGLVLFFSIPLLPIWQSREITPQTLEFSAIVSALLMLPLLYLCLKKVPNGTRLRQPSVPVTKLPFKRKFAFIFKNKPLLIFLGAFVFAGVGLGMWYGLIFIFVYAYLGKGAWFAELNLLSFMVGALASIAWIGVARKVGKKRAWLIAMVIGLCSFVLTGMVDNTISYGLLFALLATNTLCFSAIESLPQSMLSDIVDYSTWKFGSYRGSTYFSLFVFTYKAIFAIGGAVGLAIVGWYGFDPAATSHDDGSLVGLKVAMVWGPTIVVLISMVLIALMPITEQRQAVIRQRIESLQRRKLDL